MNTILQQRIEEAARDYSLHNYIDEGVEVPAFIEGADFALQNQWISVCVGLPPFDEDVFVRYEMLYPQLPPEVGYCVRWRTKDELVKTDKNRFSILGDMEITHWMTIPSLKGGK